MSAQTTMQMNSALAQNSWETGAMESVNFEEFQRTVDQKDQHDEECEFRDNAWQMTNEEYWDSLEKMNRDSLEKQLVKDGKNNEKLQVFCPETNPWETTGTKKVVPLKTIIEKTKHISSEKKNKQFGGSYKNVVGHNTMEHQVKFEDLIVKKKQKKQMKRKRLEKKEEDEQLSDEAENGKWEEMTSKKSRKSQQQPQQQFRPQQQPQQQQQFRPQQPQQQQFRPQQQQFRPQQPQQQFRPQQPQQQFRPQQPQQQQFRPQQQQFHPQQPQQQQFRPQQQQFYPQQPQQQQFRPQQSRIKTKMCKNIMQTKSCPYGARCFFAHSLEEMNRRY